MAARRLKAVSMQILSVPSGIPGSAPRLPSPCVECQDQCGNHWQIRNGSLFLSPAQKPSSTSACRTPTVGGTCGVPKLAPQSIVADDHGFIWLVMGSPGANVAIFFRNPRDIIDTETPDGSAQIPGRPHTWYAVDVALLPPAGRGGCHLSRSEAGWALAHFVDGSVRELDVVGLQRCLGPFSSGHTEHAILRASITPPDPAWEILPQRLPAGTHDNFAAEAAGRVFIAGGVTHHFGFPATAKAHKELLAMEPTSGKWSVVGELPTGYCYSAVVGLGDSIWVIGGGGGGAKTVSQVWIFDAVTGERHKGPSLPSPRLGCVGCVIEGRIWVCGGSGGSESGPLRELLSIAPGESTWRRESPAPVEEGLPAATLSGCALGNTFYILGGAPAQFLAFNTETRCWNDSLPNHPLCSQAAGMAAHDGAIWVAGGGVIVSDELNPQKKGSLRRYSSQVFSYRPGIDMGPGSWNIEAPLPTEQNWCAAWSIGGHLHVIGGAHRDQSAGAYFFDNRVFRLRAAR